ncbi:MAG: hypothetical protein QOD42_2909 [Sphingomonadales bacterium]|jgi:hypothetical protein|nr:hypothetical protein [Sphingomonadales bacterium]
MRTMLRILAMLAAALAGGEARAMIPALTLPADRALPWTYRAQPRPLRYRSGDLLITIAARPARDGYGWIVPQVTVSRLRPVMQGPQPPTWVLTFRSFPTSPIYEHGLSVGRLDAAGHRFVMWQAYTGGAHCCFDIQLILPDEPERGVISLGNFDMEMMTDIPADVDGDGRTDFVPRDNDFLYAFASFAGSFAPPQIWNVEGGRAVNVSAAPRYRALFVEAMAETRPICLEREGERNGACAAFIAAAARIGETDRAWAEMLAAYDRDGDGDERGPFPARLRAFLVAHGYLRE